MTDRVKNLLLIVLSITALSLTSCSDSGKDGATQEAQGKTLYTCGMHPQVIQVSCISFCLHGKGSYLCNNNFMIIACCYFIKPFILHAA
jgi:hypothetical protein